MLPSPEISNQSFAPPRSNFVRFVDCEIGGQAGSRPPPLRARNSLPTLARPRRGFSGATVNRGLFTTELTELTEDTGASRRLALDAAARARGRR